MLKRLSMTGSGSRQSVDSDRPGVDTNGDDETVVDADQGNVLSHIISQLRPGADLSRVTLPTFILEPRSMLERITNFMSHPETLLPLPHITDPRERFVAVTKFYLSGWHIKPPGVKKPLNPILGETFTGYWDYEDGTRGYYISEQTSHHPPKSKFLGNSVGSFMEGIAVMRFLNHNERYFITQPNMYARGILFGKMKYELGDVAVVRCLETGLEAQIDFKVKGWMGGTYNAIGGHIKDSKTGKNLYELSGFWTGEMFIKNLSTGKKEPLFDATHARPSVIRSRPIEEQGERESQRLWHKVTDAIKRADQRVATDEKSFIEDRQRQEAAERGEQPFQPHLFRKTGLGHGGPGDEPDEENLDWVINAEVNAKDPKEMDKQILAIAPILPGQKADNTQSIRETASKQPSTQETSQAPHHQPNLVDVTGPSATPPTGPTMVQQSSSALDDMSGLRAAVPPSVHRQDSEGQVFVDAES
ncbi:hypothetical protein BDV97DRAFT_351270 [Delphinella strobiligena]|nr:hypothetical protein BDV97DRAFT_351270 [Delphinella strobiligena]